MNTYLKLAKLRGYRTVKDVEVDFSPGLNIIIGKNGSGKTNFMTFLNNCLTYNYDGLGTFESELQFSGNVLHTLLAKRDLTNLKAEDFIGESRISEKVNLSLLSNEKLNVYEDKGDLERDLKTINSFKHIQFIRHGVDVSRFSAAISTPLSFDIDISNLGALNSSELFDYFRKATGSSFSTGLFYHLLVATIIQKYEQTDDVQLHLQGEVEGVFKLFCDTLNRDVNKYLPIEAVRLNPAYKIYKDEEKKVIKFQGLIFDFKFGGDWLPFSSLSDGTKRIFYLYSEICITPTFDTLRDTERSSNSIILVEEPELGIHPHQFHLVMDFLKEVSTRNQVIITTHSPQALDLVSKSELETIKICSYNSDLGTTIKKLDSNQITKAKSYMEEMYLSDYWVHSNLEGRN